MRGYVFVNGEYIEIDKIIERKRKNNYSLYTNAEDEGYQKG